jgi:hypothetical protein
MDLLYTCMTDESFATNDISSTSRTLNSAGVQPAAPGNLQIQTPAGGCFCVIPVFYSSGYMAVTQNLSDITIDSQDIGIVIGSDDTAIAPDDDALNTKILHGETAGKILYGGTEVYGLSFVNPDGEFKIRRYFTNISGGDITVKESGIYAPGYIQSSNGAVMYPFCISRDVFAPIVVADTEILEVTYTVQITV